MATIFCRCHDSRIPQGNINAEQRREDFGHARSISSGRSLCKLHSISGEGPIFDRESCLHAASKSVPNFFIRDAELIFPASNVLRNRETAGEEEKRPEVFRSMPTDVGIADLLVDLEFYASAVNQRLHPLRVLFCQETQKLIDDVATARINPEIVWLKFLGICARQDFLTKAEYIPRTKNFIGPEVMAAIQTPDIMHSGVQPVVIEERVHLRFRKAHRGREVHVVGADCVDDDIVYTREDAFFTAAKASRQNRFFKNRPVIHERASLGLQDIQKALQKSLISE